jgi:alpha-maltose-1-phosphate synthase
VKVAMMTREFPPEVYGGAGVHVEYLSRELAKLVDIEVHCFGAPRDSPLVKATYEPWSELPTDGAGAALQAMGIDLRMAAGVGDAAIVHSHTWYANLGGHLAKLLHGVPHVMTSHSLEPLRPWKADQLGGGYALSSFCEKTAIESADAVIAVSEDMANDVRRLYPALDPARVVVIHNGIDAEQYRPDPRTDVVERFGIDEERPVVMWIGRVTAQKGIGHLLDMADLISPEAQLVFLAGAADTAEIGAEMGDRAARLAKHRPGVHWIETMLAREEVIQLLSHATVFVCPSTYEPFGLINVEAMACAVPVVATAVGGIPEIVVDGVTGYLVSLPDDLNLLGAELAERVNGLLSDRSAASAMGEAGRDRVQEHFTWQAVASRTVELYATLLAAR